MGVPQAALGLPGVVITSSGAAAENGGALPPDRAAAEHAAAHNVRQSPPAASTPRARNTSLPLNDERVVARMIRSREPGGTPRGVTGDRAGPGHRHATWQCWDSRRARARRCCAVWSGTPLSKTRRERRTQGDRTCGRFTGADERNGLPDSRRGDHGTAPQQLLPRRGQPPGRERRPLRLAHPETYNSDRLATPTRRRSPGKPTSRRTHWSVRNMPHRPGVLFLPLTRGEQSCPEPHGRASTTGTLAADQRSAGAHADRRTAQRTALHPSGVQPPARTSGRDRGQGHGRAWPSRPKRARRVSAASATVRPQHQYGEEGPSERG